MKTSIDFSEPMLEVMDEIADREVRNSRTNVVEAAVTYYAEQKHPDLAEKLRKK